MHLLALTCVAEAAFSAQDCDAIMHVLRRRSRQRGESITRHAVLYSSLWRKPDLPGRVREAIERHPDKWRATVNRVRAFLRGEVRDPCPSARHWGMSHGIDLVRAQRAGWQRVRCGGGTKNLFWR